MRKNRISTDPEFWELARPFLPEFMEKTYLACEGWQCGVTAKSVLARFNKHLAEDGLAGDVSFHTFYNELRRLGFEIPVVKGFDNNTRIKNIMLRGSP